MRENAALSLMAKIITTTNGWDDASVEQWTQLITDLDDTNAAVKATDDLVRTWTHGNRPTWGKFMEGYEAHRELQPALPPPRDYGGVSLVRHLETLRVRKGNGDSGAASELATWERHIARSGTWLRVVEGEVG